MPFLFRWGGVIGEAQEVVGAHPIVPGQFRKVFYGGHMHPIFITTISRDRHLEISGHLPLPQAS